jgi:hypothetical protein
VCRLDNLLATSSLSGIKSSGHGAGAGVGGRRDARLVSNLWACGFELLHFGSRTAEDRIALPDTDLSYQGMRNLELEMQPVQRPLGIAFDLHAAKPAMIPLFETRRSILSRSCGAALRTAARQALGDGVRAFGRCVERLFEGAARLFENLWACLGRHTDRVTNNGYAATEGKIDCRAVPAVEHDPAAGGERNREDRPSRCARELMMPGPATRETFGTSAVSAIFQPSASASIMLLKAPTPPLT